MNKMDSEIVLAIFAGTLVFIILAAFGIIFTVIHKKKQHKSKIEKQLLQIKFNEELLRSKLEIQEQTLVHIGHELHDNLGQIASLIKINLNTIQIEDQDKAATKIESTKELIRRLILDLKMLSVSLNNNNIAESGIGKALEAEVNRIQQIVEFNIDFNESGDFTLLGKDKALMIFRMSQEILNNVVKHSKATCVAVSIAIQSKMLTLDISDNGIGFDFHKISNNGGSGLQNLQSRASLINAKVTIESVKEKGTIIKVELPL